MKLLGAVLMVLGVLACVYGGITYKKHEKVLDVGPVEATVEHNKRVPISPIAGAAVFLVGTYLVVRRNGMA